MTSEPMTGCFASADVHHSIELLSVYTLYTVHGNKQTVIVSVIICSIFYGLLFLHCARIICNDYRCRSSEHNMTDRL